MTRKIPIPKMIKSNEFFENYSKDKNKIYACSMTVSKAILSDDCHNKFELIFELINYLFMNYNENNPKYYSPEVCSPNLIAFNSSTKNGKEISFKRISGDIEYYSDRWCWWRVWNIYRQTLELKLKIELKGN